MEQVIEYESLRNSNSDFFNDYKKKFNKIVESGWYVLGKEVSSFEEEFATYCGSPHSVGVASGLDALIISLRALNLPEGSEVLVPSNTYIATILSIMNVGLVPVLVEPDINTYNICPNGILKKISSKTKAVMVVHLYGKLCDMASIADICKEHNLFLIEDCAQAHGAHYKGQKAGTFGDFGAFSFYPTKNLGALGDAGAITTSSEDRANFLKMFRNYGSKVKYQNEVVGMNSRLDELQAGLLRVKLKHIDKITEHKRELAKLYFEGLDCSKFILPVLDKDYYDVYHIFNIRHERRDELKSFLLENGVKTEIHYPISPVRQKALDGVFDGVKTPVADLIHNTTLSLPISYGTTKEEVYKVIEIMNSFR